MNNKEHVERYKMFEKKGQLNVEINPVDWDSCYRITEDFRYISHSIYRITTNWLKKTFIISPFSWCNNRLRRKTKVFGRENIKGIKSAIITSNHVDIFDCLAIRKAVKRRYKIKYSVAEFNNRKGFLGNMMRADGIMPLNDNFEVVKKFSKAVKHYLEKNNYIVFYPEQSMWYLYEKPRPYKDVAFHYAIKYNVPIIPVFLTFRNSGKIGKDGLEKKYFNVNIGKPIYSNTNLSKEENLKYMKSANYNFCKEVYESFYKKELTYEE